MKKERLNAKRAIKISPAMVDAALRILRESGLQDFPGSGDSLVVKRMLRAALACQLRDTGSYPVRQRKLGTTC